MTTISPQHVQQSFKSFYDEWLLHQENLLEQLLTVSTMSDSATKIEHQGRLIDQVLCHYRKYLEEKSKVANVDVFLMFSPTWLSAYERALLWIWDYKPSLILRLANSAVDGLTAKQRERMEGGDKENGEGDFGGNDECSRKHGKSENGEDGEGGRRNDRLGIGDGGAEESTDRVSERGDELRASTMRKVMGTLSSSQTVQFLAATMHFQWRVKKCGLEKEELGPSHSQ